MLKFLGVFCFAIVQLAILLHCFGQLNRNLQDSKSLKYPAILFTTLSAGILFFVFHFIAPAYEIILYPFITTMAILFLTLISYFLVLLKYFKERDFRRMLKDFLWLGLALALLISIWVFLAEQDMQVLQGIERSK